MTCVLVVIYNAFIFYSVIKQIEHSYFLLVIIFVKIFKENFIIPLHPTFSTLSLIWARLLGFKPLTPGQQLDALPPSYRSNLLVGLPECVEEEKNLVGVQEGEQEDDQVHDRAQHGQEAQHLVRIEIRRYYST